MLHAVDKNFIKYFPITIEDINMTEDIYGTTVLHLQGKTVHQKVKHYKMVIVSKPPQYIINLIHINGLAFLYTASLCIIFSTGNFIKKRTINTIESVIKWVNTLYLQRELKIIWLHADGEFDPLWPKVTTLWINLDTTSKKEHVNEIERFNRLVKERMRLARSEMIFQQVSKRMIIHLFATTIFGLMLLWSHVLVQAYRILWDQDSYCLEIQWITKIYVTSRPDNTCSSMKNMILKTMSIRIKPLEPSRSSLNTTFRAAFFKAS